MEEEKKPDTSPANQPLVHVHIPDRIQVEVNNPIVLGFQLGCGPFVMTLAAWFILFLAFLLLDIAVPSF